MSLLPTIGAVDQDTGFYNGVATTSLRFNSGSSHHLHRTPAGNSSDTDKKKYTFSTWIKRTKLSTTQQILAIGSGAGGAPWFFLYFTDANKIQAYWYSTTSGNATNSSPLFAPQFRDTSAWYNIVLVVDTTDGTATDRFKLYVNGVRAAVETAGNALLQNFIGVINSTSKHWIGRNNNDEQYLDGYLAETIMVDGTAIGETSGYLDEFGEVKKGVWIPKEYSGSYGTNGFRLKYTSSAHDATASEGAADTDNVAADSSGSNHHWIVGDSTGAEDCAMPDSPENNFCTLNPNHGASGSYTNQFELKEGNLHLYNASAANQGTCGTILMESGKWYWEIYIKDTNSTYNHHIGVVNGASFIEPATAPRAIFRNDGIVYYTNTSGNGAEDSSPSGMTAGEVWAVALDADNNTIKFYVGGSQTGNTISLDSPNGAGWKTYAATGQASADNSYWNYGQDSSFAGEKTSGSAEASDSGGIGDFYYTPPTGYLALCTANLEEPTIGPNSATQAVNHFGVLTYTGDGNQTRTITSGATGITGEIDFQPDWIAHKIRSGTTQGTLNFDSSRGFAGAYGLDWSDTTAEGTVVGANSAEYGYISGVGTNSFDVNDGTAVTNGGYVNYSGRTYVAWNWKANGNNKTSFSESGDNPAGTHQANQTAGFSIVTTTGTGDSGATIAHGLGAIPKMIIARRRTPANGWAVYHHDIGTGSELYLNLDQVKTDSNFWITDPTTSVFSVSSSDYVNKLNDTYVFYCFAEIEGYSKIGSFTGNGVDEGAFVYTGFRPSFVMSKSTAGSADWHIMDVARNSTNVMDGFLFPSGTYAEASDAAYNRDFLSNGFKIRGSEPYVNSSGVKFIYMAFAEAPFKYANAR
jgi:hypothetical protein